MTQISPVNFLLIGFGDLGKNRIYPELLRLGDGNGINIYASDLRPEYAEISEKNLFTKPSPMKAEEKKKVWEIFRRNYYYARDDISSLTNELNNTIPTIAYIAIDNPSQYKKIISKYVDCCDLFAIEKPFALSSKKAVELAEFLKAHRNKRFVPVDHYRHKWGIRALKNLLDDSNTRRLIEFSDAISISILETERIPMERKNLLTRIGVIFDIAPHIFACLNQITYGFDEIEVEEVYTASYTERKNGRDVKPLVDMRGGEPITRETYAEMILTLFKNTAREKPVYVRFGKAAAKTSQAVIEFYSGDDVLRLDLKKEKSIDLRIGGLEELNLSGEAGNKVADSSYSDVLSALISAPGNNWDLSDFMTVQDAVKVTEKLEEAERKGKAHPLESYKAGRTPGLIEANKGIKWSQLRQHIRSTIYVPQKVIIFDLFGVVVNYEAAHRSVFAEICRRLRVPRPERYQTAEFLRQNPQTIVERIFAENDINRSSRTWAEKSFRMVEDFIKSKEDRVIVVKGSRSFIEYLRSQNMRIALVSAAPRYLIDTALTKIGLTRAFHAIFSGYDRFLPKSDSRFYELIREALHEPPENCFVLDDLEEGIIAANRVGMTTIAFHTGRRPKMKGKPSFVASSFDAVRKYIDNKPLLKST
jgi:mannitol-1-/sugar-/sorbitol-6-/2-deoxyglucose-6-phosphatase